MKRVVNVGGGFRGGLPPEFSDWQEDLLDIDPVAKPDILLDAKLMNTLDANVYDAVYCSHTLEHFYKHEVPLVLAGFLHVMKKTGYAQIVVPDMEALFKELRTRDIDDTWYTVPAGPISFHDVIYGWGKQVSKGNLYFCHKTGFSTKSITKALHAAGFKEVFTATDSANLYAYAFKSKPDPETLQRLGVN